MNKHLVKVKALLEQKRTELAEDYSAARSRTSQDRDDGGEDYIDTAVASYTKEFLYSLTDLERRQLIAVEKALGTIDEGTYGTCEECGEAIEDKRLEAVPWASYCLSCQELADRGLLSTRSDDEE